MSHASIIAALGGPNVVAEIAGVHPTRPIHWRRLGIPTRHWPRLIEAARDRKVRGVSWRALAAGLHGVQDWHKTQRLSQHEPVNSRSSVPQTEDAR